MQAISPKKKKVEIFNDLPLTDSRLFAGFASDSGRTAMLTSCGVSFRMAASFLWIHFHKARAIQLNHRRAQTLKIEEELYAIVVQNLAVDGQGTVHRQAVSSETQEKRSNVDLLFTLIGNLLAYEELAAGETGFRCSVACGRHPARTRI